MQALLTVDAAIIDKRGRILLIKRSNRSSAHPGEWALPGGFFDPSVDRNLEIACAREVLEETGLEVQPVTLVGVYSERGRDERGPVVSVLYICKATGGSLRAGDDASDAMWVNLSETPPLAFDHDKMVEDVMDSIIGE